MAAAALWRPDPDATDEGIVDRPDMAEVVSDAFGKDCSFLEKHDAFGEIAIDHGRSLVHQARTWPFEPTRSASVSDRSAHSWADSISSSSMCASASWL